MAHMRGSEHLIRVALLCELGTWRMHLCVFSMKDLQPGRHDGVWLFVLAVHKRAFERRSQSYAKVSGE
eukprot:3797007-Pyramimonas_sp.AAC.1